MEFCGMKREIDRKCLNHARVHANAQSFDRCEGRALTEQAFEYASLALFTVNSAQHSTAKE